jgi:hypothetical protein
MKSKKRTNKAKKSKRTKVVRIVKRKNINKYRKQMKGGAGELDITTFFEGLDKIKQQELNEVLKQSLESEKDTKTELNDIILSYEQKKDNQLYDFIYVENELTTLWDHGKNMPETISAGKPGVHIYVIKTTDGKFEIIGKFLRKI